LWIEHRLLFLFDKRRRQGKEEEKLSIANDNDFGVDSGIKAG